LPAGEPARWAVKNLGTALGFEPGLEFERTVLTLHANDALILYSDGVSEAFNPEEECYGNERLLVEASALSGKSAPVITTDLLQKVREFANSAPQSDDIAILSFKVQPGKTELVEERGSVPPLPPFQKGLLEDGPARTLELHATSQEVMRGVEILRQFAQAQGLPEKTIFDLALALEECGSNIVNHALRGDPRQVFQVAFNYSDDTFVIELRDSGPAFDPTAPPQRPLQAQEDDLPGGWGIQLVRRSMDQIRYERRTGENFLCLTKRIAPTTRRKHISPASSEQ